MKIEIVHAEPEEPLQMMEAEDDNFLGDDLENCEPAAFQESFYFDEAQVINEHGIVVSDQLYKEKAEKPEWRDPEEEYFRLSVLSLKMQYNEVDKDFVFQIGSKKLFKQCKSQKIPFHKWYKWIDSQLRSINQQSNPNVSKETTTPRGQSWYQKLTQKFYWES